MNRIWLLPFVWALAGAGGLAAADENAVISPRTASPAAAPATVPGSFNSVTLYAGLALAAAGGWMVWRHRRNPLAGRGREALRVDETRPLGNRQFLVVASYEGKKFLLGVCPGRIDLLAPLDGSAAGVPPKARE